MNRRVNAAVALLLCVFMAWPALPARKRTPSIPQIDADSKIEQVLNRLTFGSRPTDAAAVRQIGITSFIDAQLHPETLPENPVLEQKLAALDSLRMTSSEMVANYPPTQHIRAMARGNMPYPADPAMARAIQSLVARYKAKLAGAPTDTQATPQADAQSNAVPDPAPADLDKAAAALNPEQKRILSSGNPAERVAMLESLPVMQQYDILEALPRGKRQQLFSAASPELRRRIQLLQGGPQQLVNSDLAQGKILRAVYSNRQLEEVLTDFWYNHFNVFLDKGADRYLVTSYERDVIRPRVLSSFQDLLLATAQSPAMLFYLDNAQSVAPGLDRNPDRKKPRRGLNENYAREIMELHTLGVEGGYTQQDVTEVARCFTGWTIRDVRSGGAFFFNPRLHDNGEKTVLGVKILAGGGISDGLRVIDILAHHPSTARFISRSLATRFVADDPPSSLVDRMASTFTASNGDLRAVLKTMFSSPEFFSPASFRVKVKSPFEMLVSALRTTGADIDHGFALERQLKDLGQPLYRKVEPTGYSNKGADWLNSASLLARMNFAVALTGNKVPGVFADTSAETTQTLGGPEFQKR